MVTGKEGKAIVSLAVCLACCVLLVPVYDPVEYYVVAGLLVIGLGVIDLMNRWSYRFLFYLALFVRNALLNILG